jgi:hypothetical protein
MFNWSKERNLLEKGPFKFRMVEHPIPEEQQQKYLSAEWSNIIKDQ